MISFCINLDKRLDRWEKIKKDFERNKIEVHRFPAQECLESPWQWCTLSHLWILKLATKEKWEYVCVFEDDISFYSKRGFKDKLKKSLENIPPDWHILYLWGLMTRDAKLKKINDNIFMVKWVLCTYGIVYSKKSFYFLIKNLEEIIKQKDKRIDNFLAETYQLKNPCYITSHLLVYEKNDFSDIDKKKKGTKKKYEFRFFCFKYWMGGLLNLLWIIGDWLGISDKYRAQKNKNFASDKKSP